MAVITYDLTKIKALIFDVDGVLSNQTITLSPDGEPLRTINIKDGYAMQLAVKRGLQIAIITGGTSNAIKIRYEGLGVKHIYMASKIKTVDLHDFMDKTGINPDEILFMGDDIPDYEVMKIVGLPVCPKDAVMEIKQVVEYISPVKGGEGCARDVIEQVMKVQGLWMNDEAFGW